MLQETHLQADDLVLPVFVNDLNNGKEPINAMPEVYRWSLSSLIDQIETWYDSGLKAFALFPCISEQKKCPKGLESQNENSISYQAARKIKERFKDIILIADLALDPFTSHGHDGILNQCGIVDYLVPFIRKLFHSFRMYRVHVYLYRESILQCQW